MTRRISYCSARHGTACLLLAAALAAACGGDIAAPVPTLSAEVAGRLERGSVVTLRAALDGRPVPPDSVRWSASAEDAAILTTPGRARLLRTGSVTLTAAVGAAQTTVRLDVAAPPIIVFDRAVDSNRDIWRVALDGGDLVRLTDHPSDDLHPTVAGGWVWFTSYRAGQPDIHRVRLEGGAAERVTAGGGRTEPAVSRDGSRLAFVRLLAGSPRVHTSSAAGADERRVTAGAAHDVAVEARGEWSPDGARLLFVTTAGGSAGVWVHTPASNAFTPLFQSPFPDLTPAWSPDGGRVVFASARDGNTDLYLYTLASAATTRLTMRAGSEGQPVWLADGRIVFTASSAGESQLMWLDLTAPDELHPIHTGAGSARNAAAVR
jgi:Tol biopolymer transport system component